MISRVLELFGRPTDASKVDWPDIVRKQHCPFLNRKCLKVRKSAPAVSIGTCSVRYGKSNAETIICPQRLLDRQQVFADCVHLLTQHEPGNEFHVVAEITVPGGNIDYMLVSAHRGRVMDFVGIELQTLDTTGTVWPERQRFLHEHGVKVRVKDAQSRKRFGMNWKMTAKTTLVQLHHKVDTFQQMGKHLVIVLQDRLLAYMKAQFSFEHLRRAKLGDPMHLHSYSFAPRNQGLVLELTERSSTDATGIAKCLGLQASACVELAAIVDLLEAKIGPDTRYSLGGR